MKEQEDAYGRLLLAYLEGDRASREIAERDDGFIAVGHRACEVLRPVPPLAGARAARHDGGDTEVIAHSINDMVETLRQSKTNPV